jgi:hypothetical protein
MKKAKTAPPPALPQFGEGSGSSWDLCFYCVGVCILLDARVFLIIVGVEDISLNDIHKS